MTTATPRLVGPCMKNPCENNGICFESSEDPAAFICKCSEGFKGETCDQIVCEEGFFEYAGVNGVWCKNMCEDIDCNHGYCKMGRCVCHLGWNGSNASLNCDKCTKDCGNGHCNNDSGVCQCEEGWKGENCKTEVMTTTATTTATQASRSRCDGWA